jgi:hypothetical protein
VLSIPLVSNIGGLGVTLTNHATFRRALPSVEQKVKLRFNRYLRAGTVLKNMRNVLIMILRLRQVCAHATLIVRKPGEAGHHDE